MTSLTPDENDAKYQIRSYRPSELKINDQIYQTSVILSADQLIPNWSPKTVSELKSNDFDIINTLKPDILLIGTGSHFEIIDIAIYGELINQGIGVELMDTAAACRTFSALTAEKRNVVAALLIS